MVRFSDLDEGTIGADEFRRKVAYGRAMRELQESEGWQLVMQKLQEARKEAQNDFDQCYSSDGNVIRAKKLEIVKFDKVVAYMQQVIDDGIATAQMALDAVQTVINNKESDNE